MTPVSRRLFTLEPLDVPDKTPGVYFALLPTGEVKIGSTVDIGGRLRARAFKGCRLIAVLPGGRGVETDLHAQFRPLRSRLDGPGHREIYAPDDELAELVLQVREHGFSVAQLRKGLHKGTSAALPFDDDEVFQLELTHLHFVEQGSYVPRHLLEATCSTCGKRVSSAAFVRHWEPEFITTKVYLVLRSGKVCSGCKPIEPLPSALGFPKGVTSIRLADLRVHNGLVDKGFDRDYGRWCALRDFGVRRMAKHPDDPEYDRLRLQPCTQRKGRAQNAGGKQLKLGGLDS